MTAFPVPLTALSEAQRAQALERFAIIRPALEDGVTQAQVARTYQIAPSTVQMWIKRYQEKGLAGLANNVARSDKGKSRRLPREAIQLIEGLALQTPPRSAASIHRQVSTIAKEQGWPAPSYNRVYTIIKKLDPALVTLAHQGAAAYREEFDLLYRREATHSNAMWQADHTPLDIWLLDEAGKPAKPWLTVIEDDYSRCIAGFRLSFQESTALTTALALRTGIWRKEDPRWQIGGIPSVFYTDHGSDFTSKHIGYREARKRDFCLYGFAVEYQTLGPKLLAVYNSNLTKDELLQSAGSKGVLDPARALSSVELTPYAIAEAFSNSKKYSSWEPKSKLLVLLALKQDLEAAGRQDQSLEIEKLTDRFKLNDAPADPWKFQK